MKKKVITVTLILILIISAVIYASCAGDAGTPHNLSAQTADGGSEKSGDDCDKSLDDCLSAEMACLNAELACLSAEMNCLNSLFSSCNGNNAYTPKTVKR